MLIMAVRVSSFSRATVTLICVHSPAFDTVLSILVIYLSFLFLPVEEFFEEFYNIVPKITELKEQHQFDYLELFYLLQLKKDYKLKTMEDIKKTEENMKNLAKSARLFNSRAVAYYRHLRNCESFILE